MKEKIQKGDHLTRKRKKEKEKRKVNKKKSI